MGNLDNMNIDPSQREFVEIIRGLGGVDGNINRGKKAYEVAKDFLDNGKIDGTIQFLKNNPDSISMFIYMVDHINITGYRSAVSRMGDLIKELI